MRTSANGHGASCHAPGPIKPSLMPKWMSSINAMLSTTIPKAIWNRILNAPGGIRDINQIGWIAKRHFRVNRIYDLVHLGFISEFELGVLEEAESFLWEIRHHLHRLTKRDENRLLFDYQRDMAAKFGYARDEAHHPNR